MLHYFFSIFFQSSFLDGKFIPFSVIFTNKRFNFCYSAWMFLYSAIINRNCYSVLKIFVILLLMGFIVFFCFLSSQENLHMILQYQDLFYDIFNATIEHNGRQTHSLVLILNYFDIYFKWIKSFSIISPALAFIMISMLSLFECITRSSSLSMEEINLFAIANRISHMSDFLRSFMMSFKYGLFLSRYSLIDNIILL